MDEVTEPAAKATVRLERIPIEGDARATYVRTVGVEPRVAWIEFVGKDGVVIERVGAAGA